MSNANRCGWLLAVAVASLALAACGGSSNRSATASGKKSTTSTSSSGSARAAGSSTSASGAVRAKLVGENHTPIAKKNWSYTVTATDAHGHPLSGTVLTEFAFEGTVVGRETPPTHPLKNGHLKDTLDFPPRAVGYPVELQVVVHTRMGSVTLDWPVKVKK